jgi:arginase
MAAEEIKTIQVIGFPMDLGADRRGVDQRPSAIRIAGLLETVAALLCSVEDAGDIAVRVEERPATTNICSTATTRTSGSLLRWT